MSLAQILWYNNRKSRSWNKKFPESANSLISQRYFFWSPFMNVAKKCASGSQVATTDQRWRICPRLTRQLVGRRGIVSLSLGMHWVICGNPGRCRPLSSLLKWLPDRSRCQERSGSIPEHIAGIQQRCTAAARNVPHSLIRCQRENISVIKPNTTSIQTGCALTDTHLQVNNAYTSLLSTLNKPQLF